MYCTLCEITENELLCVCCTLCEITENELLCVLYTVCRVYRDFSVRLAYESDTEAISNLVSDLYLHDKLLDDLTLFHQYRRDPVCISLFPSVLTASVRLSCS